MMIRVSNREGRVILETEIKDFPLRLGRTEPAQIVINEDQVSALHAELDWDGSQISVRDLGSSNGTFDNKEKILFKKFPLPCRFRMGDLNVEISEGKPTVVAPATVPVLDPVGVLAPLKPVSLVPLEGVSPVPRTVQQVRVAPRRLRKHQAKVMSPMALPQNSWQRLSAIPYVVIVFFFIGLLAVTALTHYFGLGGWDADLGLCLLKQAGAFVAAFAISAGLCLPTWFLEEKMEPKPFALSLAVAVFYVQLSGQILFPLSVHRNFGFVFMLADLITLSIVGAALLYYFLMTLFTQRGAKIYLALSMLVSLLVFAGQVTSGGKKIHDEAMQKVFQGEENPLIRAVAGKPVDVSAVKEDLLSFETQPEQEREGESPSQK